MSTFLDQEIACRACGQRWARPVATFLDEPDHLAAALEALREDRFQRFACPGCGQRVIAARPLRWCDRRARTWIAMLPEAAEPQWPRWERDVHTMARWDIEQEGDATDGWTLRLVFGLLSLREKLLIAEAGLDDAVVELLKLELMDAHPDLERAADQRLRLVEAGDRLLSFAGRDGKGRWQGAAATRQRYEAIRGDSELWATARADLVRGPYVDLGRMLVELPAGGGRDLT